MPEPAPWRPAPPSHAHVVPRLAASVVLVREADSPRTGIEVLLTRRPATMAFAADVHVFPGGAVDAGDRDPALTARSTVGASRAAARLGGDLDALTALATHVAALRELAEEAGILLVAPRPSVADGRRAQQAIRRGVPLGEVLEDLDGSAGTTVRLAVDLLVPLSRWVTPPLLPRRFDARFFVAALPPGVEQVFSAREVVSHQWIAPRDALDAAARGALDVWLPTHATLAQLADLASVGAIAVLPSLAPWLPPRVHQEREGIARVELFGAGGVPGRRGCAWLVGQREVLVVDPGDPAPEAAVAILEAVAHAGGRPVGIVLTGSDPERAAGAESIAMRLGIPIVGPPGTAARLPHDVVESPLGAQIKVGDLPLRFVDEGGSVRLEVGDVRLPLSAAATRQGSEE